MDRYRLVVLSVFNVFLLLSISQLKESLISGDLFSFSCWKALVSWILTFADFRMVNGPSPLGAFVDFSQEISLELFATRSTLPQSLKMMGSTWLMSSSSTVKKIPTAQIAAIKSIMYAPIEPSRKPRLSSMEDNEYFSASLKSMT